MTTIHRARARGVANTSNSVTSSLFRSPAVRILLQYFKGLARLDVESIVVLFLGVSVVIWFFFLAASQIRYIIYLFPVVGLAVSLARGRRLSFDLSGLSLFIVMVSLFLFGFFRMEILSSYFWRDVLAVLSYTAFFAFRWRFRDEHVAFLAVCFVGIYVGEIGLTSGFQNMTFDMTTSEANSESMVALAIGAFAVYFLTRGHILYGLLLVLFMMLGFKRIALGACLIGILAGLVLNVFQGYFTAKRVRQALALAIACTGLLTTLYFTVIVSNVASYLDLREDLNIITQGRYVLQMEAWSSLKSGDWSSVLFGRGSGVANDLSLIWSQSRVDHMHSEYMKWLIDFGIVGTLLIIAAFSWFFARHQGSLTIWVYLAVLFLTENIFVYSGFMAAIMIAAMAGGDRYRFLRTTRGRVPVHRPTFR